MNDGQRPVAPNVNPLRELLTQALRRALAELDPAALVRRALPEAAASSARPRRVRVIAAGKAAAAMAKGALERWPDVIEDLLVVTVPGAALDESLALTGARATVITAAHPLPDARSLAAAEEALARAASLGPGDELLALLSGGASALLSAPAPGLTLASKQVIVAALLERGAPIQQVNLARRHLSRVKGGRLARLAAARGARVSTLMLSDVVGGAMEDIGSGPTVPDPTTVVEAAAVLARFAPELGAEAWLEESVKADELVAPGVRFSSRLEARILADPASLAAAVGAELTREGLQVTIEGPEEGSAHEVAERRIARAAKLGRGEAVVIACEPSVTLPEVRGRGGRAGWVALAALRRLPPGVALLCGASDGVDGSSGEGGAVVIGGAALTAGIDDATIEAALAGFDDATIHRALGTHIQGGASGHNLTDVHVLARA